MANTFANGRIPKGHRAGQDRYVIYQYEWSAEPTKLTTAGQEHVVCMARDLGQVPYEVIIDPSPDAHLNELRRVAVIEALAASGCPTDPARVCVGHPEAEGLYGQEAPGIAAGMLSNQGGGQGAGGGAKRNRIVGRHRFLGRNWLVVRLADQAAEWAFIEREPVCRRIAHFCPFMPPWRA